MMSKLRSVRTPIVRRKAPPCTTVLPALVSSSNARARPLGSRVGDPEIVEHAQAGQRCGKRLRELVERKGGGPAKVGRVAARRADDACEIRNRETAPGIRGRLGASATARRVRNLRKCRVIPKHSSRRSAHRRGRVRRLALDAAINLVQLRRHQIVGTAWIAALQDVGASADRLTLERPRRPVRRHLRGNDAADVRLEIDEIYDPAVVQPREASAVEAPLEFKRPIAGRRRVAGSEQHAQRGPARARGGIRIALCERSSRRQQRHGGDHQKGAAPHELEEALLCQRSAGQAEVMIRLRRRASPACRSRDEPSLEQIRLDDVLERFRVLRE